MSSTFGCKVIGIRKLEFVTQTQFFYIKRLSLYLFIIVSFDKIIVKLLINSFIFLKPLFEYLVFDIFLLNIFTFLNIFA